MRDCHAERSEVSRHSHVLVVKRVCDPFAALSMKKWNVSFGCLGSEAVRRHVTLGLGLNAVGSSQKRIGDGSQYKIMVTQI